MSRNEDALMHLVWARQAVDRGDFLGARMGYLKSVESLRQIGNERELVEISKEYEEFVSKDPIFHGILSALLPLIQEKPGILQSDITKSFEARGWPALYSVGRPIAREDVSYALYFAEKLGKISRVKKGRSYELRVIGV